jgi:hypothetical protein
VDSVTTMSGDVEVVVEVVVVVALTVVVEVVWR